MIYKFNTLSL